MRIGIFRKALQCGVNLGRTAALRERKRQKLRSSQRSTADYDRGVVFPCKVCNEDCYDAQQIVNANGALALWKVSRVAMMSATIRKTTAQPAGVNKMLRSPCRCRKADMSANTATVTQPV